MKNDLFEGLKAKIAGKNMKIVFPEGVEPRIIGAAHRLQVEELITPILLGNVDDISTILRDRGLQSSLFTIIDPANYDKFDDMVASFVERRAGKVTEEKARDILLDVNYFGTMLVYMGLADGLVSGAVHSTADTVRPALQIIKTKPGISRTSGAFLMVRAYGKEKYIFSDCAINIEPGSQELAEIAVDSADTAKLFDIDPRVAMLSFSTNGSGASDNVTKVADATKIAKELRPDLDIDGEMQFDAAFVPEVGRLKFPDSKVAGNATVFVFPDLQSGNIGYKIAQRLGGFEAIGPILQGLNKPVSDLSRGSNEEDVYKLSIITAAQALM
ncbi:phosphate acetyltransferase [Lactococcus hodotermopsidis]|uniref:Phosphate acetyltransferase n=1 Tax=Pseudolactococcus hodotermopsidis TaxID=2709157 RepID=A0A6A0BA23_9LACT|nr:phosphate acetyltransferase [Lactococcus hodotermopsidis]GFH42259.1 phosphate acetyltransferase [Lactococcus hodotermopsidis]